MIRIYEIQLLSTAVIGTYVSFVLLFISRQNRLLNKLLGFYSLTISIFCLLSFAISLQWASDFVVLIRTFLPLYYFLPAIGYLYFRSYLLDATHLSRKDLVHLIPITLHLIYISPLVYHLFTGQVLWSDILSKVDHQTYFFNYGPIPDVFHVIFRLSLMIVYVSLAWKCYLSKAYRDFLEKNKNSFATAKRWIFFYLLVITCNAGFSMIIKSRIFFLQDKYGWANGNLITICLILSYDLMFAYAVLHPEILFGIPHFKKMIDSQEPAMTMKTHSRFRLLQHKEAYSKNIPALDESVYEPKQKINEIDIIPAVVLPKTTSIEIETKEQDPSELNPEVKELIVHMEAFIIANQPYRQEKFNIESLSEALDVPQHHIAYLFKHVLKKSFVEYRNELRVNHVIESIQKGKHHEITMEAIGIDAGFGSKVSFFTVFKKLTGKTPGQYADFFIQP